MLQTIWHRFSHFDWLSAWCVVSSGFSIYVFIYFCLLAQPLLCVEERGRNGMQTRENPCIRVRVFPDFLPQRFPWTSCVYYCNLNFHQLLQTSTLSVSSPFNIEQRQASDLSESAIATGSNRWKFVLLHQQPHIKLNTLSVFTLPEIHTCDLSIIIWLITLDARIG